jgi:hypothetical protein
MSQRINSDFILKFNQNFTSELSMKYQNIHQKNCHHWDFTFLPWHRKFVNEFWEEIGLPRTYAVLTEDNDRKLYSTLKKSLVINSSDEVTFVEDDNKLNSFTSFDLEQIKLDIAEAMICKPFAIDLDFVGTNRDFGYNLSFTSQVEQFHDMIHGETSRGMRNVITAGGDQCFFIHHTFVDLIFETWLNDNPELEVPISKEHFESSPDLQEDYESYDELVSLFTARHFTENDYKYVRRIAAPLSREIVLFEEIKHIESYRRVIMFHNNEEIGRFAVLTGRIETCLACARNKAHIGQFLLRKLVPVSEIIWNINNQWYTWETAKDKFLQIGMSIPKVVSF